MRVIDTHVHVWELDLVDYGWLTPAQGALYRDITVDEAVAVTGAASVDRLVLVQAADSLIETRRLVEIARATDAVVGVVGWLPIASPADVERLLEGEFAGALGGVRTLVHQAPDPDLLTSSPVVATVRLLGRRGLPFEIPDAFPRLAVSAERLVGQCPDTVIVIDHLGKPGTHRAREAWAEWMHRMARHPGTVAKLSGLASSTRCWTASEVRPLVDVALDAFGPDRLMFGADWPLLATAPDYRSVLDVTLETLDGLSDDERSRILHRTAERVYGLPTD